MATSNAPSRKTSDADVNMFNQYIRSQPWYQEWFTSKGLNPNNVKLSRGAQSQLEALMASKGLALPSGMHIDQAGNVNQKNRLARNVGIGAAIGGLALTGVGLAGAGPLAGMLGGGAAAAGGAGAGGAALGAGGTGLGLGGAATGSWILGGAGAATAGSMLGGGAGAVLGGGAAAAAPSLTSRILGVAGRAAPIVGGMAAANTEDRANNNAEQRFRDQADLERFKVDQTLPDNRLSSATNASRLSNVQPFRLNWQGAGSGRQADGGFKPTGGYYDYEEQPEVKQMADDIVAQRLQEQLTRQQAPKTTDPLEESTADKIIGGAATGTALAGAIPKPARKYYSPSYVDPKEVY